MSEATDSLAATLRTLRERWGDDTYANRRRLLSVLSDKLPEAKPYIRSVDTAVGEGLPDALAGCSRDTIALTMDGWVDRLANATAMQPDMARSVVRAVAYSLDLGPMPSQYRAATPAPPSQPSAPPPGYGPMPPPSYPPAPPRPAPAPPPANGQSWVGGSIPVSPTIPQNFYRPADAQTGQYGSATAYGYQPTARKHLTFGTIVLRGLMVLGGLFVLFVIIGIIGNSLPKQDGGKGDGQTNVPAPPQAGYADEARDFGVAPRTALQTAAMIGTPTPTTIPVGRVVTTAELKAMLAQSPAPQLIDALADGHASTIPGAARVPIAGAPGTLTDANEAQLRAELNALPAGAKDRALVFFCASVQCWESYNAVLRANAAGFTNLYWYRGGLASWAAAGNPFDPPLRR